MATINGTLLLTKIGDVDGTPAAVAFETEATVTLEQEELDITNKDSKGFHQVTAGKKSGSLSFTAYMDAADSGNFDTLRAYFGTLSESPSAPERGNLLDWELTQGSTTGDLTISGSGLLTSLEVSTSTEETATISGSITFSGPWTVAHAA